MNPLLSRRNFLQSAPLVPLAVAGALSLKPATARANEPIKRLGGALVRPALNVYSFNSRLAAGVRGESGGVTLFQLLDFCAEHGLEGIDATGYYMPGWPNPPPASYIHAFKRRAFELGVSIIGTGTHDTFISPDKEFRAAAVRHIKQWVDVCVQLGGSVVRVFCDDLTRRQSWKVACPGVSHGDVEAWCADDLRECANYGQQHGVMIGVQNHGDFNGTAEEFLQLLKRVGHEYCCATLDTGYFVSPDPYADIARVAPYAINWTVKQSVNDGGYGKTPIDLDKIMGIVRQSGYRGFLPIETLSAKGSAYDPFQTVPAYLARLRSAIARAGA